MPFEDIPSRLEDILDAIKDIENLVSGKFFDDYRRDTMLRLAVERCVEIISEATRHVPSDMKANIRRFPGKMWPASATSCVMRAGPLTRISCGKSQPDMRSPCGPRSSRCFAGSNQRKTERQQ